MNRSSLPSSLGTLKKWHEEKNTLRFNLSYQRHAGMWNSIQKSMLVWSILSDSYIPPLIFLKDYEEQDGKDVAIRQVCDGKQRLTSLFEFIGDEENGGGFRLHASTPDVDIDGDVYEIQGLKFSELTQEMQNLILGYKFSIQDIEGATAEEAENLFLNINNGCSLSVIQKSKPRLGDELCQYFRGILEKPFFTQAINLSANQCLKEDDLAVALQAYMLLSEGYDDFKSISVAECFKFAEWLRNNLDEDEQNNFTLTIEYLGVFDKKMKFLKKTNIVPVIVVSQFLMLQGVEEADAKSFFNDFFSSESEEYAEYCGAGSVKKPMIEGRVRVLKEAACIQFDLDYEDDDENSEVDSDEQSSDDTE
ncbi:MAG: DUF262 domain-containing protein [Aeriscardovia sp.]|nr:DUF262 domain-containing protein [Aeriscardovia sp.]